MYNCWGCVYFGGGFMQGWRCVSGQLNGGTSCYEWLEGETFVCRTYGQCEPMFTGDSLDVAVVSDGESVELARRVAPGVYSVATCAGQHVLYLDSDGLALASVARTPSPQSSSVVKLRLSQ